VPRSPFRVIQQSLSVDNEAGVYEHQKAIMAELAASRHLQIRRVDSTVGHVLAPTGRFAAGSCSACRSGPHAATSGAGTSIGDERDQHLEDDEHVSQARRATDDLTPGAD
jgi:hypothetical protein